MKLLSTTAFMAFENFWICFSAISLFEFYSVVSVVISFFKKGKRFYVAADDNAVQSYLIESGEPDGMVVRFTAHVTHLVVSQSGRLLVAGAR